MVKQFELFDTFPISIINNNNAKEMLLDSGAVKEGYSLICDVDATHSGTLINNRVYPPESMRKGIHSWTKPYKKPVLVNHDDTTDPIGRVIRAKYLENPRTVGLGEYKPILKRSDGYGHQKLTLKVTDPGAIQKILDGRYETVSVRMTTDHAWCSVCETDWSEDGPCEHMPGQRYDGKLAYTTTGDLSYREISFVNIPADEYAGVKEALLVNNEDSDKEPVHFGMYASNPAEKILIPLGMSDSSYNLYGLMDSEETEEDDVIVHLIEKSSKVKQDYKEEDVKIEELTKDQLKELGPVKELIEEEVSKQIENARKEEKEACEISIADIKKNECISREEYDRVIKELEALKANKDGDALDGDSVDGSGGNKEGQGAEAGQEGEDIESENKDTIIKELELERQKLLDENIKINTERHKMIAEKLFDLKRALNKPDVSGVTTPDARDKKIEELAQRSLDSLKDQISDLMVEQGTIKKGSVGDVSSPGIAPADKTNEVELSSSASRLKESKRDRLSRLFSKGSR